MLRCVPSIYQRWKRVWKLFLQEQARGRWVNIREPPAAAVWHHYKSSDDAKFGMNFIWLLMMNLYFAYTQQQLKLIYCKSHQETYSIIEMISAAAAASRTYILDTASREMFGDATKDFRCTKYIKKKKTSYYYIIIKLIYKYLDMNNKNGRLLFHLVELLWLEFKVMMQ